MERHDALVCPVASVQPFDKTELFPREIDGRPLPTYISWIAITYGLTLVGHPVLVLPCGVDDEGLPFGLQIVGRRGRDAELLALGFALEEAFADTPALSRPLPDLAALAVGLDFSAAFKPRSEEHTSELQALMRIPYAVFC